MSKSSKPDDVVGVGLMREPDSETFNVNEGWDMQQVHAPDNSVVDSLDFVYVPDNLSDSGPHTVYLPHMPGMYLDPKSLFFVIEGKFVYINTATGRQEDKLPTYATIEEDPFGEPIISIEKGGAAIAGIPAAQQFQYTTGEGQAAGTTVEKHVGVKFGKTKYTKKMPKIAPINLFSQAMWKDIEIKINGTQVTRNANLEHPISVYLAYVLSWHDSVRKNQLSTEMWFDDDLPEEGLEKDWKRDQTELRKSQHKTKGWHKRRFLYANDNNFQIVSPILTEVNTISSFLMDKCNFSIKFTRNSMDFCLLSDAIDNVGRYVFRMKSMKVKGRYMIPSPRVDQHLQNAIKKTPVRYATRRTQTYSAYINKASKNFLYPNIFCNDTLPDQILMVMIESSAKNGVMNRNPWFFEHFDANQVTLQVNQRDLPKESLNPDFENNVYQEVYRELFSNVGISLNNTSMPLDMLRYKHGRTIFAWDLNHDKCAGLHNNHTTMNGVATMKVNFTKELPFNVTMVILAVYRDYLQLDEWRNPDVLNSYGVGAVSH